MRQYKNLGELKNMVAKAGGTIKCIIQFDSVRETGELYLDTWGDLVFKGPDGEEVWIQEKDLRKPGRSIWL